jgi:hypothetical protein
LRQDMQDKMIIFFILHILPAPRRSSISCNAS